MRLPDFGSRIPAFREGFEAFLVGNFESPYVRWKRGVATILPWDFIKSREWQHGQDVGFLVTQHYNTQASEADAPSE